MLLLAASRVVRSPLSSRRTKFKISLKGRFFRVESSIGTKNIMSKSFVESSSQTNRGDFRLHLHHDHKNVSNTGIQTDDCDLESLTRVHQNDGVGVASSSIDHDGDLHRRFNPTQPSDFATLQAELLQWRRREEDKIMDIGRNDAEKQEMTKLLMKKEAHLLRKIELLKNSATDKRTREKIRHVMELMSQPKQWEVSDGFVIAVDTPKTCRAREMKAMHDELNGVVKSGKKIRSE
jgi:hypothetical protein